MNKDLFLAVILSFGILLGFQHFYAKPHQENLQRQKLALQMEAQKKQAQAAPVQADAKTLRPRDAILKEGRRITVKTSELSGSINLKGARFDDLSLINYHETADQDSPAIVLLSPSGSKRPQSAYYADFSWLAESVSIGVPSPATVWKADSDTLTPEHSVRLTWDNRQGLLFERTIAVDDKQMFTVTDRVTNKGGAPVTLYPFGTIARQGIPHGVQESSVFHEGALGVINGTLEEFDYEDLIDDKREAIKTEGGWLGITDKYWLVAMIPPQDETVTAAFVYNRAKAQKAEDGFFQTDFRGNAITIAEGGSVEYVSRLFAGAKRVNLLDQYSEAYNIPNFDRAIDFGWFYFLTRPFLYLLTALERALGGMGLAILLFTVLLKLVTLPLSQKSYRSMARMKEIQPEIKRIQKRFAEDKMRQGQETMELYKREKVNPLSGCFPMLIQIPIFFALYKVLYVNIEMRQAPFYGWIHDMSAPDPTSVFTLFGLLPFDLPMMLQIGAWPLLMGITMLMQQKLSPQPPDKAQARIFLLMPVIFTFMLAHMPAGLVIYWTWNNILSLGQQWYIILSERRKRGGSEAVVSEETAS